MLRTKPTLGYCGLTVVVSHPSRFDSDAKRLCSGNGGIMFSNHCLRPEFNNMMCDFRTADDKSEFLPGTKCVLLMGEHAMHQWAPDTALNTINEMRGSPLVVRGIPAIATFTYQDAVDIGNVEARLNPLATHTDEDEEQYTGDDEKDEGDVKRFANTSRSNYPFWIRADVTKCKQILANNGVLPARKYPEPQYKVYPSSTETIDILRSTKGAWLDFDMETDYERGNPNFNNVQCFSFSVDNARNIYCVPVLNPDYTPAYSGIHRILSALAFAIRNNTIVAHNGAGFDFLVLALKLGIPVYECFDTLILLHRIFPFVEKSLGHGMSYWTWERFHKDQNPHAYRTQDDMMNKLRYCGKDVYGMSLIRQEAMAYATKVPGLRESIELAMRSIRPYNLMSLLGIQYDSELHASKKRENDGLMKQYLRMIRLLIGDNGLAECQSVIKSKKPGAFPSSNPQCCKYFHDILGYPVVQRGKPHKITNERQPSLAKKAMFSLRLNHDNPVIDTCIAYRQVKLETTTPLGFIPWKDDDNRIFIPDEYKTFTPTASSAKATTST